jgi:hypothetical protein
MPTKQLLLIKYLFNKGEDILSGSNSFSAGLAISLFQDAVELLLWTIAKEYPEVQVKEKDSFDQLWSTVSKIQKDGSVLGLAYSPRIIELNKARVNFKHYGNLPALSEAQKFRGYVDAFLTSASADYLGLDFKAISLVDIIRNVEMRDKIKSAEECESNEDYQGCIMNCAHAGYMVFNTFNKILPRVKSLAEHVDRDAYHNVNNALNYVEEYLNALRDFSFISLLNINIVDYIRYRKISPRVHRTMNGIFHTTWSPIKITPEDASFCIEFVTNCALAVEDKMI